MKSVWNNWPNEKPTKEGLYLVNLGEGGSEFFRLIKWEKQDITKTVFFKEYNQFVKIFVKEGCFDFDIGENEYIFKWMEIPE